MVTTVGKESKLEDVLDDLVRLEYDAVAAYEHAIDRLHEPELRAMMAEFNEDHLRHIEELEDLLTGIGRKPPRQGGAKRLLTRGKVAIGGLIGDTAVLYAMRSNEDDTNTAYERAARFEGLSTAERQVIERARNDERRHRDRIVAKLKEL